MRYVLRVYVFGVTARLDLSPRASSSSSWPLSPWSPPAPYAALLATVRVGGRPRSTSAYPRPPPGRCRMHESNRKAAAVTMPAADPESTKVELPRDTPREATTTPSVCYRSPSLPPLRLAPHDRRAAMRGRWSTVQRTTICLTVDQTHSPELRQPLPLVLPRVGFCCTNPPKSPTLLGTQSK